MLKMFAAVDVCVDFRTAMLSYSNGNGIILGILHAEDMSK